MCPEVAPLTLALPSGALQVLGPGTAPLKGSDGDGVPLSLLLARLTSALFCAAEQFFVLCLFWPLFILSLSPQGPGPR